MAYSDEFNYSKDIIPFRYIPPRNPERNRDIQNLFTINDCFDVNYTDEYGQSHLHVACKFGTEKIVKDFLDHGAYPNDVEIRMEYVRQYFCKKTVQRREMFSFLLKSGVNPNWADAEGRTPLHVVCKKPSESEDYWDNRQSELRLRIGGDDILALPQKIQASASQRSG
uniref:Uncharacterized protein n=1 Tax=Trichogramma kaykai TaxID=54128 RepID=A0ABD2WX72_9HYME